MRRWILSFAVVTASACLDEDLTLGEACVADEECLGDQICGRTPGELQLDLPGVCVGKDDTCLFGEQLGCVCDAGTLPGVEDDFCVAQPERYKSKQIFIACDLMQGSPTYGQCIIDPMTGS